MCLFVSGGSPRTTTVFLIVHFFRGEVIFGVMRTLSFNTKSGQLRCRKMRQFTWHNYTDAWSFCVYDVVLYFCSCLLCVCDPLVRSGFTNYFLKSDNVHFDKVKDFFSNFFLNLMLPHSQEFVWIYLRRKWLR